MTTNPRFRAGQPAPVQIPVRRVNAEQFDAPFENRFAKQEMPVQIHDDETDGAEEMIALLIMLVIVIGALSIWWLS